MTVLVIAISTERAARAGVLIKNRTALERVRTVDVVLVDKTGTLTRGEPELKDLAAAEGTDPDELLALAAAAESDSEHPLARAIVAAARGRGLPVPQASGFTSLTGRGVRATIGGRTVLVGGPAIGGGTDVAVESAGVVLSPATGAVLLSASTIVVALNTQLLRGLKLNPADVGVK